jgi:hypothetical protein
MHIPRVSHIDAHVITQVSAVQTAPTFHTHIHVRDSGKIRNAFSHGRHDRKLASLVPTAWYVAALASALEVVSTLTLA